MITARLLKIGVPAAVVATTFGLIGASSGEPRKHRGLHFDMVPSAPKVCLPGASARVTVRPLGPVEKMHVEVKGLPPKTDFDFFVIQYPKGPFGLSWYQGDIETDEHGNGEGDFIGRFNRETFIVSPGLPPVPPPNLHKNPPFPDATSSVETRPVHTFHLGLWFNSPKDAAKAGCSGNTTPFNGDHTAGVQVLNTSNFDDDKGPLIQLEP